MIEIKVNDEIRDVRAEFLIGLTIHQMLWCGLGLALCGGLGLVLYFYTPLPLVLVTYLVVFLMLPFGAMAFFTWHEMDMLTAAKLYITRNLCDPILKTYGSANRAYAEHQEIVREREKIGKKEGGLKPRKKAGAETRETMGNGRKIGLEDVTGDDGLIFTDPKNEYKHFRKEGVDTDGN